MDPASIARRLTHLEGLSLSPEDLESIRREFEDFDCALAELEAFADGVEWQDDWPSCQVQPHDA